VRVLISLLNHIPTSIAAHFQPGGFIGRFLRVIISRTATGDDVVAVVRAGHGRGIRLPLDPTQEKYYWAGQHDVPVQDVLMRVLKPGTVFWDIGAHVGFFTILASRVVGSIGRVHAFEPMPLNLKRLGKAAELNRTDNVTVHGIAVGGTNGSALLHGHQANAMWTLVAERASTGGVTVRCRTIDSLASDLGDPEVIKVDVEGAELDVLRGGLATIQLAKPTLVVEFAAPEFVDAARTLLPLYQFEQLSDLDWLLVPYEEEAPASVDALRFAGIRPHATKSLTAILIGSVVTGLSGQIALLVSGVLAARLLGPEDRGNLALLVLIPMALSQLGSLGLPLALTYEFSRNEATARGSLHNLVRPALALMAALVVLHALIVLAFTANRDIAVQTAAAITLLVIPADSAALYGLAILQGRRDFTAFNILRLLPAVSYSALACGAFLLGAGGLPLFAMMFVGSYALIGAITLATALQRSPPQRVPASPHAGALLRFGVRGLFGSVSPLETLRLDQAIVGLFLSPASLGLYVVGVAFTNLPRFVAQSIGVVAYPHVTAQHDPARARRSMWRFFAVSVVVSAAVILPLEVLAGWVVRVFFGDEFAGAVPIMQILLVSSLFLSARRVLTDTSRGTGQPGLGTVAEIASWVSLVPGIALLAPPFGAAGVALAFTISAAISLAVLLGLVASRQAMTPRAQPPDEPTIDIL
jgi:FkbM family methyltransferase